MSRIFKNELAGVLLIIVLFCAYGISIQTSHAYLTTNQSAQRIDAHGGIFLIEYQFGVAKNTVHMPLRAVQGTSTARNAVSYHIYDNAGNIVPGKAAAIVLSNTPYNAEEGMYIIPKNMSKKFTLLVVFTPDVYDAEKKYRLQVTHLPFSFNGTNELQLNPSELQYYTTSLISL